MSFAGDSGKPDPTNIQFQRQTAAFLSGLQKAGSATGDPSDVAEDVRSLRRVLSWAVSGAHGVGILPWAEELNTLISGSTAGGFDVSDLRENTVLSGGYQDMGREVSWEDVPPKDDSPCIQWLWRLLFGPRHFSSFKTCHQSLPSRQDDLSPEDLGRFLMLGPQQANLVVVTVARYDNVLHAIYWPATTPTIPPAPPATATAFPPATATATIPLLGLSLIEGLQCIGQPELQEGFATPPQELS
eukprot:Skav210090  [mRNA]  locus=scaffold1510:267797:270635:- [translate_table: standard]